MQTIVAASRFEADPVKGSRFIADVAPVPNEAAARAFLATVAAEFPDASHHCWAWRIAEPAIDRASDDGEPSGSAGRPILGQLAGRNLVDSAVIVTRYFGGTKLGVGGLVRAYGGAAGQALDRARLAPWIATRDLSFVHDYAHTDSIERLVTEANGTILDRSFGATVTVDVRLPVDGLQTFVGTLADLTLGAIELDLEPGG